MSVIFLNVIAGTFLLLLGRQLFWLFVGVIGFVFTFKLAEQFFSTQPDWLQFALALVCGLIGIIFALIFYRIDLIITGMFAGGILGLNMSIFFSPSYTHSYDWLVFIIGAAVGGMVTAVLLDWAVIVLSSLIGAMLIVESLALTPTFSIALALCLAVLGILIQGKQLQDAEPL